MRRHKSHVHRRRRSIAAAVAHTFRERQIYLRAEGEVQFITLRPWTQAAGLTALMLGLFWLAFSTINIAFKGQLLALHERGMYDARIEYDDRLAAMRNQVDRLTDQLLINQGEYLGRVDEVKAEFDRLAERHKRLVEFFRQSLARKPASQTEPAMLQQMPKPTEEMPADSHGDQSGMQINPYKTGQNGAKFAERLAAPFRTPREAARPLAELRAMFGEHRRIELALMDEALRHAEEQAARAGSIFQHLGINEKAVAANSDHRTAEVGGPLIAVSFVDSGPDELADRMEQIIAAQDAYEKLKHEALQLPLQMPMNNIKRVTSGYGVRRDPFRHTIAMHGGVDFKNDLNSPVYATADGKVNIAGWEGAYGRMVEIFHDNGVATRYAHLGSITVAAGDMVKRGDMVGRLGNTGRSTGPHLHYETRVKGRAVDPVRFWQTSNAVQKLSEEE
jgi:murein DD-endopeptidase MepM/ murein hydrolase activator NlpD